MAGLRLALAQFDFPVGAVAANADRICALMGEVRSDDIDLLVCPELALSGCPAGDLLLRRAFLDACQSRLAELAAGADGVAGLVGFPHSAEDGLHDAAALLCARHVADVAHQQVVSRDRLSGDVYRFVAGRAGTVAQLNGVRVGLLVGADIWSPEPVSAAARAGAELLVVIAASPFDAAAQERREAALVARARETGCAIAWLNRVGGQDELVYDGASLLIAGDGSVAARAPAFEDALLRAEFDPVSRQWNARDWPASLEGSAEGTLYAALMRGLRDYVRKNGFDGVLLGLSGGVDSALTLAIAVDALGASKVTAVMLPSRYTSALSLREAHAQARTLGVEFRDLPVGEACEAFTRTLAAVCGELADITAQNLQARTRGVLLMALSNQTGTLLLSTGNKSEAAVGYATLYGDMCGGYDPLADVYKTQVYALARWRNQAATGNSRHGTRDQGPGTKGASAGAEPVPGPRSPVPVIPWAVIERAPSAELRADQTDQESLPPYEVLDGILKRCIEGGKSRADIVADGYDANVVDRVLRMLHASEFKRHQAAPGPRVSTCAFGCEWRWPISNGWR